MPFLCSECQKKKTNCAVGFFEYGIENDLKLSFYGAIMSSGLAPVLLIFYDSLGGFKAVVSLQHALWSSLASL